MGNTLGPAAPDAGRQSLMRVQLLPAAGVGLVGTSLQLRAEQGKHLWGGRDLNPRPEDYESPALTG